MTISRLRDQFSRGRDLLREAAKYMCVNAPIVQDYHAYVHFMSGG
jgi:hypothetical protein